MLIKNLKKILPFLLIFIPTIALAGSGIIIPTSSGGGGSGNVSASSNFGTDNRVIRSDGTAKNLQASNVTLDDTGNITGVVSLSMTGTLDVGGAKITSLGTPSSSTDAATKAYADAIASGLSVKASCSLATTSSLSATYLGSPSFTLTGTSFGGIS